MLWVDMGLGKTVMVLSSLAHRLDRLQSYGALVVAPKRVVESVWHAEAAKWSHLQGLRFNLVHGAKPARARAALTFAHVYVVSYDNLKSLADTWTMHYLQRGRPLPVDTLVLDEITKVKNSTSQRHAHLGRMLHMLPHRIGLTGTPASNGYQDLHGQFLAIDDGERLGRTKTAFQQRFLHPEHPGSFAQLVANSDAERVMQGLVSDITIQMDAKDYLDLPPVVEHDIALHLPAKLRAKYKSMEDTMFLELESGRGVESFNAAALSSRCLQFAQGAVYLEPGSPRYETIHDVKLEALDDILEEANGKPVLTLLAFQHDGHRIMERYAKSHPGIRWVSARMPAREFDETLDLWERGELPMLLAHPASMGHGVDRLKNGPVDDLVWFGHTWSLDLYEQTLARLVRQGRTRPVRVHHLQMVDTVQDAQRIALTNKATTQDGLKAALNEYRRGAQVERRAA